MKKITNIQLGIKHHNPNPDIKLEMTSGEFLGNHWFYIKYIEKYLIKCGKTFDPSKCFLIFWKKILRVLCC